MLQFLGTSTELAVGPVAVVSLFLPSSATNFGPVGSQGYIDGAIFLALYTGVILLLASILRIGFLIENLLSQPV